MFRYNNNQSIPPVEDNYKPISFSQNTPNAIPLPSPFLNQYRGRFNSFNSTFLSPMRLIQSPNISDTDNFFEFQLRPCEK